MSDGTVALLLDENVERRVAEYLRTEGFEAELVVDVLGAGAEDASDIVPYAREHDLIVVTKDVDFLRMDDGDHARVFFLDDHRASAYAIAMAALDVLSTVPSRETLRGVVVLDDWL